MTATNAFGEMEQTVRAVAAGLQDSTTRKMVALIFRSDTTGIPMIDLQACSADGISRRLLNTAELKGGPKSQLLCAKLGASRGAVLYLNREDVRRWDGTTIPPVTALVNENAPMPSAVPVYLSPARFTTLSTEGATAGPVLVVVPVVHPDRRRKAPKPDLPAHVTVRVPRSSGRVPLGHGNPQVQQPAAP